jgi:hypothetical protein
LGCSLEKLGLRKHFTNSSVLPRTSDLSYPATGGSYIQRFSVAIPAITFLVDWQECACLRLI